MLPISPDVMSILTATVRILRTRIQDFLVLAILFTAASLGLEQAALAVLPIESFPLIETVETDVGPQVANINTSALMLYLVVLIVSLALWTIPAVAIANGELVGKPVDVITALGLLPARFPRVLFVMIAWMALVFLGSAMFFLPGIFAFVLFWVIGAVAVLEGRGEMDAFIRAGRLTAGLRWTFVGILVPGLIASAMFQLVVIGIVSGLGLSPTFTLIVSGIATHAVFTNGLIIAQTISYHAGVARNDKVTGTAGTA